MEKGDGVYFLTSRVNVCFSRTVPRALISTSLRASDDAWLFHELNLLLFISLNVWQDKRKFTFCRLLTVGSSLW